MVVIALLFLLFSCQSSSTIPSEQIPPAGAYLEVNLMYEDRALLEPLAYSIYRFPRLYGEMVGHKGLLVVHNVGSPTHPFSAYDLICPHDYPDKIAIEIIEEGESLLTGRCPKCQTEYDISMGMGQPIKGIGKYPLLQYPIQILEDKLIVHN